MKTHRQVGDLAQIYRCGATPHCRQCTVVHLEITHRFSLQYRRYDSRILIVRRQVRIVDIHAPLGVPVDQCSIVLTVQFRVVDEHGQIGTGG